MKATQKKKKKKGSRRTNRSKPESKVTLKPDSDIKEKDEKQRSQIVIPKRGAEKTKEPNGQLLGYIGIATQFLRDAKMELKKVKWPTRKELLASTAIVIVLVLIVSIFLGLIDFGLIKIIRKIIG